MLSLIKLSGVRDDEVTKDVWKALFDKGVSRCLDSWKPAKRSSIAAHAASDLSARAQYQPYRNLLVNLGQSLYPSESAFPTSTCEVPVGVRIKLIHIHSLCHYLTVGDRFDTQPGPRWLGRSSLQGWTDSMAPGMGND